MKKILQNFLTLLITLNCLCFFASCKKEQVVENKGVAILNSNPQGAEIYYNGKKIGVTPKEIKGVPKKYIFKLSKEGYRDNFTELDLKIGTNTVPEIQLEQLKSSCLILTDPIGVSVYIKGQNIGTTPLIVRDLTFGQHEIVLKKSGFLEKYKKIDIDDARPKKIYEQLISNLGVLELTSTPSGVSVYLGENFLGETPFRTELSEGEYKLTFKKPDYYDLTADLVVESGKTKTSEHTLTMLPASLKIDCPIKGAEVYLDGKLAGKTPALIENLVAEKEYELLIKATHYISNPIKLKLTPGTTKEFFYQDLKRNVGDLELLVNPPGVTVYIDGQKIGVIQPSESKHIAELFTVKNLSIGTHTLKLSHKLAKPDSIKKTFEINADETTRISGINLWIPNTEIIMKDGSREIGLIISENKRNGYILFEPRPGLRYSIRNSDIEEIISLSVEE